MRPLRSAAPLAALAFLASGCAGVDTQVVEPTDHQGSDGERVRFCLSLGRALNAIEADGTTPTARDAAEEALARAPEELTAPATTVVDHLQRAHDGEEAVLSSPRLRDAVEALRDGAERMCGSDEEPER